MPYYIENNHTWSKEFSFGLENWCGIKYLNILATQGTSFQLWYDAIVCGKWKKI